MEADEARAAIDGWFRDRSTDDAAALEAFRVVALSDRTTAAELGELRLQFVDYLVATRGIDRAAAVKIASVRMDAWFAGARQATSPNVRETPSAVRLAISAGAYAVFAIVVAWVLVRLTRGPDFTVAGWFWFVDVAASIVLGAIVARRAPERYVRALYAAAPIAVAGALLLAGP
jgi:hypothetical protein